MKEKTLKILTIILLIISISKVIYGYGAQDSNPNTGTTATPPPSAAAGQEGSIATDASNPAASGSSTTGAAVTQDKETLDKLEDSHLQSGQDKLHQDSTGILGDSDATSSHTIDEVIDEAQGFISSSSKAPIDQGNLDSATDTIYNILLTIGIFAAVAIGMYLGIKFMTSSAEDKAKVKESLIPYIAGCVVIFGAFIIWKLAIMLLRGIS